MVVLLLSVALSLLIGCAGEQTAGQGATALFRLPKGEPSRQLFELPYPNDLRLRSDGTIDLGHLSSGQEELLQHYFDFAANNRLGGFGTNGAAFFRFSEPIDPDSLPETDEASVAQDAPVVWINVDPGSPDYGRRLPLRFSFRERAGTYIGPNSLAVRRVPGFVMRPGSRYAVLITDGLRDIQGRPVQADEAFAALLDNRSPDTELQSAHAAYESLRAFLDDAQIEGVVSAALFSTGEPTALAGLARDVVYKRPAPVATDLVVVSETDAYVEIQGKYVAPNFQQGSSPYPSPDQGGAIAVDPVSGEPEVVREEQLRFALTIPSGPMPEEGWPVVLYAHGTGGDFRSFIRKGVAERLARVRDKQGQEVARLAMVGIDQVIHGTRAPAGTFPDVLAFNMTNPKSWAHNLVQGGIDNFSLLRMVRELRFSKVPWAAKSGRSDEMDFGQQVKLDAEQVGFMGHSQGTLSGPVFVAHEPAVCCVVLSGAGGDGAISFLRQEVPVNVANLVRLALKEPVDEFHPVVNLWQQVLEQADPNNYAALLIRQPLSGHPSRHLLLGEGLVDHYTPIQTTESLALAIGLPLLGPVHRPVPDLALAEIDPGTLPATRNVKTPSGAVTAGLLQYPAVPSGESCQDGVGCEETDYCDGTLCRHDGHYVMFQHPDAQRQISLFFATTVRDGTPTIVP